ncbi:MAG: methionyl-tRNA formyltransferase [Chlorobi bacterium]|nr:methionyl-tRNA formyltransferase [Chlorobiota bacterium]
MTQQPRIVFFGTPSFAVPTLERLHREWGVVAVVTAPDAPAGRGRRLQPPAVKVAAEQLGIQPILQPPALRDTEFINQLRALAADVFCVLAFRILPPEIFALPQLAFNVHPSLLPKFRGPAPIAHTIIAGERETGITTFILSERVDAGMILLQERIAIPDGLTAGDLAALLAPQCGELASRTIAAWCEGTLKPIPQNDALATKAPKLYAESAWINWNSDAEHIRNWIHGHSPEPGAWTLLDGIRLKIYRARIEESEQYHKQPGTWEMDKSTWRVHCQKGTLELVEVQLPGKRIMQAAEVVRGWRSQRCGVFHHPSVVSHETAR